MPLLHSERSSKHRTVPRIDTSHRVIVSLHRPILPHEIWPHKAELDQCLTDILGSFCEKDRDLGVARRENKMDIVDF